jgi:hypothetical protein
MQAGAMVEICMPMRPAEASTVGSCSCALPVGGGRRKKILHTNMYYTVPPSHTATTEITLFDTYGFFRER